jgi:hypothetical protein
MLVSPWKSQDGCKESQSLHAQVATIDFPIVFDSGVRFGLNQYQGCV